MKKTILLILFAILAITSRAQDPVRVIPTEEPPNPMYERLSEDYLIKMDQFNKAYQAGYHVFFKASIFSGELDDLIQNQQDAIDYIQVNDLMGQCQALNSIQKQLHGGVLQNDCYKVEVKLAEVKRVKAEHEQAKRDEANKPEPNKRTIVAPKDFLVQNTNGEFLYDVAEEERKKEEVIVVDKVEEEEDVQSDDSDKIQCFEIEIDGELIDLREYEFEMYFIGRDNDNYSQSYNQIRFGFYNKKLTSDEKLNRLIIDVDRDQRSLKYDWIIDGYGYKNEYSKDSWDEIYGGTIIPPGRTFSVAKAFYLDSKNWIDDYRNFEEGLHGIKLFVEKIENENDFIQITRSFYDSQTEIPEIGVFLRSNLGDYNSLNRQLHNFIVRYKVLGDRSIPNNDKDINAKKEKELSKILQVLKCKNGFFLNKYEYIFNTAWESYFQWRHSNIDKLKKREEYQKLKNNYMNEVIDNVSKIILYNIYLEHEYTKQ